MVNKRPFHDDGIYEVGCKNPRQQEDPELYINDGTANCDSPQNPTSGERSSKKYCDEEKTMKETPSENLDGAKEELWGNASSSNGNGNAHDEYVNPAASFHHSFFQHLFDFGHQETSLAHPRQGYSLHLEHDPQRIVPVGIEYQALLPDWKPQGTTISSNSCSNEVGTCLVPMPSLESSGYSCTSNRGTRIVCSCLDRGSISCVRLHVTEAREKLREELGQEFGRLGLSDMGEEVAQKWSEEEEQSFYDAVCSNPASSRKNFWHILTAIFPTRTKQELVNYYFNVFMLRKRAAQNRFDPQNIDSDNDEWQANELGMTDEEDESLAESFDQENHGGELPEGFKMEGELEAHKQALDLAKFNYHMNEEHHHSVVESFDQFGLPHDHDFHGWEGETEMKGEKDVHKGVVGLVDHSYLMGVEDKGGVDDISRSFAASGTNSLFQFTGKTSSSNDENHDAGDDSCTSFENQSSKLDT